MNSLDWDDLRYVLAVNRHGSAAAAARALDVTHATVLRRVQAVEQSHGIRLFDRSPSGYVPTQDGRTLVAVAEAIESSVIRAQRQLAGQRSELEGTLRFTTTDSLMDGLLVPLLAGFRAQHPAICLEVAVTNAVLDLNKREADVTLRPALHPPEALVGVRLARMDFAIYGAPAYLDARGPLPWTDMDWLMPDAWLRDSPVGHWLRSVVPSRRAAFKANSFVTLRHMAEAGLGVAALPCFVGRRAMGLRQIEVAPAAASSELHVLTHADLRLSARVRAFMDHIAKGMRAQRALFEADQDSE